MTPRHGRTAGRSRLSLSFDTKPSNLPRAEINSQNEDSDVGPPRTEQQ